MSDLHPLPVLPPCPSWCTLPIGHQPASGDDACWVRSHVAFCSEHVSVEAVETYEVGMRADVEAPRILVCDVDNR